MDCQQDLFGNWGKGERTAVKTIQSRVYVQESYNDKNEANKCLDQPGFLGVLSARLSSTA